MPLGMCPLNLRANFAAAVTLLSGRVPTPPFPRLTPAPWPQTAKATEVGDGAGTLALPFGTSLFYELYLSRFLASAPCPPLAGAVGNRLVPASWPRMAEAAEG